MCDGWAWTIQIQGALLGWYVTLVFPYTDFERAVVIGHEMKQHATVSRLNYRCCPSADRGAVCQASSVSPLWGLRDPGPFILTSCSNKTITSWPDLSLRVFKTYIISDIYILCGSVVENCVSSAKGCGFDSQGTHILTKKCITWMQL